MYRIVAVFREMRRVLYHLPRVSSQQQVRASAVALQLAAFTSSRNSDPSSGTAGWRKLALLGAVGAASALGYNLRTTASCERAAADTNLPEYTRGEVAKHRTPENRVWVTKGDGVYDITDFIALHPGGAQRIMLAAGGPVEPFWGVYQQHNKQEVRDILEPYKIGKLAGGQPPVAVVDPYAKEPERHPALITLTAKPFNAETPAALLAANLITPTDLFFTRNHLPVPEVDMRTYKLVVEGEGSRTLEFSLQELKSNFKKHTITMTMQCSGNRRSEMQRLKPIKGLEWQVGGISTATFSGVRLRDVLLAAGLSEEDPDVEHIQFVGLDTDPATQTQYGASIPAEKAMSLYGDVILAYEMNGEPLTADHGYPLRVVVPGVTGARSVKWLSKIIPAKEESSSHWQQKDYKSFCNDIDWDTVDWSSAPAIQESPVTSAITEPQNGTAIKASDKSVTLKGYAWSGGGRGVIRVDVSVDGGKTWEVAELTKLPGKDRMDQSFSRQWAWCLWQASVAVPKGHKGPLELICKATDSSYNSQPDTVAPIWNLRGVVNNAWHRVQVNVE